MPSLIRRSLLLLLTTALLAPVGLAVPAYATYRTVSVKTVADEVHAPRLTPGTERTMLLGSPARDLAVHWLGSPQARVLLSLSNDGEHFGSWVEAGRDEVGEHTRNGRTYGALVAADGAVAVRLTTDRPVLDAAVVSLADGARTVHTVRRLVGASAAVAQPAVTARSGWRGRESPLRRQRTT